MIHDLVNKPQKMKPKKDLSRCEIHCNRSGPRLVALVFPVVIVGMVTGVLHSAEVEIETIALTGMQVPGAPEGVVFGPPAHDGDQFPDRFTAPRIDGQGRVIFTARMTGPGINVDHADALFLGDSFENLAILARAGDQAPGLPEGVTYIRESIRGFLRVADYHINDTGQYLFRANVVGPDVTIANNRGLWTGTTAADVSLIYRADDPAPGFPGAKMQAPDHLQINRAGQFAFWAWIEGAGIDETNNLVIWTGRSANDLKPFLREGQTAPDGLELDFITNTPEGGMDFFLNDNGQFLVVTVLTESGYMPRSQPALIAYLTGKSYADLKVAAVQGEPAPALPEFTIRGACPSCSQGFNNDGRIATKYGIRGPSGTETAIWTGTDKSDRKLIVRTGEDAPDTEPGTTFSGSPTLIVGAGPDLLLFGSLTGESVDESNDFGIWKGTSGADLRLVARRGDTVAGIDRTMVPAGPIMNSVGQIVFGGRHGLYFYDANLGVRYIIGPGDTLEVAPGDFRTIRSTGVGEISWEWYAGELSGPENGVSGSFNDQGQLAFRARFDDGSDGIFVARLPKPTTVLQVADTLSGPWTVIDEAVSPHTVTLSGNKFYRVSGSETLLSIKRDGLKAEISWSP